MNSPLKRFLLLWFTATLALWIVDGLFESLQFDTVQSLVLSGLILALTNLTIKPLLMLVALPFTLLTFGLAIPVINGLVLLLVAEMVPGFAISGFWMGVLCALAVSIVGLLINLATGQARVTAAVQSHHRRGPPNGPSNGSGSSGHGPQARDSEDVIDVEASEKRDPPDRLSGR